MKRRALALAATVATLGAFVHCGLSITGAEPGASPPGSPDGAVGRDTGAPPVFDETATDPQDAAPEAAIAEAGGDAGCPAACSQCTLGTCEIACTATSCPPGDLVCPPGLPCAVSCVGSSVCNAKRIVCAAGQRCRLTCNGKDACNSVQVTAADAGAACIDCQGDMANRSCVSMTCALPTACGLECGPGGSRQSCTSMESCGAACDDACSF